MTDVHEDAHRATELADKRIALFIAVLALLLAFSETGSKSTQTEALGENIEAADLWAFYQAKTIRQNVFTVASELAGLAPPSDPAARATLDAQRKSWSATIARLDSDPTTGEGRKELTQRAQESEARRDQLLARNHQFELSSAALQIAIVLASATVITGVARLLWLAGALGLVGAAFFILAFLAPSAIRFF